MKGAVIHTLLVLDLVTWYEGDYSSRGEPSRNDGNN